MNSHSEHVETPLGTAPETPPRFDTGRKLSPDEFAALTSRAYSFETTPYLRTAWDIVKRNLGWFVGYTALVILIVAIARMIPVIGRVILMAISAPLSAGVYVVALKERRGERTEFSDFFTGFTAFVPLLLAGLVSGILITIGFVLLIVPGVYLCVSYVFTVPLIIDKRIDFWQAMEASRKLVGKAWFEVFGFVLVLALINLVGALLLLIGLTVTLPLSACAIAVAYDAIVNSPARETPPLAGASPLMRPSVV